MGSTSLSYGWVIGWRHFPGAPFPPLLWAVTNMPKLLQDTKRKLQEPPKLRAQESFDGGCLATQLTFKTVQFEEPYLIWGSSYGRQFDRDAHGNEY